ncbi:hypothetical protein G6F24_018090 [Rhizopus arrhizus]|nr:hypothetical protein G6F24_018090 [Rhizopus arrhizus]
MKRPRRSSSTSPTSAWKWAGRRSPTCTKHAPSPDRTDRPAGGQPAWPAGGLPPGSAGHPRQQRRTGAPGDQPESGAEGAGTEGQCRRSQRAGRPRWPLPDPVAGRQLGQERDLG